MVNFNIKSPDDVQRINTLLATQSFLEGGHAAAALDSKQLEQYKKDANLAKDVENSSIFKEKFPHLCRWWRCIEQTVEASKQANAFPLKEPVAAVSGKVARAMIAAPAQKGGPAAQKGAAAEGGASKKVAKRVLKADCSVVPCKNVEADMPEHERPSLGAFGRNFENCKLKEPRYLTTAIMYSNGPPHIGHTYETVMTDVCARYYRLCGHDTFYQTGTDEYGQKIQEAAEKEGVTPIQLCDKYAAGFKGHFNRLGLSHDNFMRTTNTQHMEVCQANWKKAFQKGDIYLGEHEGWYLVREERYITDQEAKEMNYVDPMNKKPLQREKETNYLFKLSKYAPLIKKKLEDEPDWCRPEQYRQEMLGRLEKAMAEGLRDLSVSRTKFPWGVPCPGPHADGKKHCMYVWFDALTNYYSGIAMSGRETAKYWPATAHFIGKDITWFHTVIWGSMLLSLDIPLPKSVVVHGFLAGPDGQKMSKSLGNVVSPHDVLQWCPPESLRWYLCKEADYGRDMAFSPSALKLTHNADLCDKFGNLANRAISLSGGSVPEISKNYKPDLPFDLEFVRKEFCNAMEKTHTKDAAEIITKACVEANQWIANLEPWKIKDNAEKRATIIRYLMESVYILAHFFGPFVPRAAEGVFKKLHTPPVFLEDLKKDFVNLKTGTEVKSYDTVSFPAFDPAFAVINCPKTLPGDAAAAAASSSSEDAGDKKKGDNNNKGEGKGRDKKAEKAAKEGGGEKKEKPKKAPAAPALDKSQPLYSRLDLRVGKIIECENHPEADRLYVEKIDVGEAEPRQILSGLREHYQLEEMVGRKIVTICNLQPRKMVGLTSYGMVLCAKSGGKVEFAAVPESAEPGDHIQVEGDLNEKKPWEGKQITKNKVWEEAVVLLKTDANCVPCFDGKPLEVRGKGRLTSTLASAELS